MRPHSAAHPGIVDVTVVPSTSLEPAVARDIADIAVRFGSPSYVMLPLLATALATLALAIVPLAAGPTSGPDLRRLMGTLVGPVVLMVMASVASALVIGWMRKVKAELALRALDVEPVLRKRAYRIALSARRSPRVWFLKREDLSKRVVLRVMEKCGP